MISSELVGFRKWWRIFRGSFRKFSLACWRNPSNDLFENLIFALVFSAIVLKETLKMLEVFFDFVNLSWSFEKRLIFGEADCFQDIKFGVIYKIKS